MTTARSSVGTAGAERGQFRGRRAIDSDLAPPSMLESARYELALRQFLPGGGRPCFWDYMKYREVRQGTMAGGPRPFEPWPYLLRLGEAFGKERLISILKSRQVGFSWLVAAWAVYNMVRYDDYVVMMFSRTEADAKSLMSKCVYIYKLLPEGMRYGRDIKNDTLQTLSLHNGSEVIAFPSTENAGRGLTGSLIVQDEADFHPYMASNLNGSKPSIDNGGQHIMGSTSNKKDMGTVFKGIVNDKLDHPDDPNKYHVEFVGWHERPGHDEAWYQNTKNNIPAEDLGNSSPELYMAQEYPGSIKEALSPAPASVAFDHDMLKMMFEYDVMEPIRKDGVINIYREFSPLRGPYVCGTDSGHGIGRDFSVSVVMEKNTGQVVADIMTNQMDPTTMANETMRMLSTYEDPRWCMEINEWGVQILKTAETNHYPRLYDQNYFKSGRDPAYGFQTNQATRRKLWGTLAEQVRAGALHIPNREGMHQFFDIIYNQDKDRMEAVGGRNDDYPMAVGLALVACDQTYNLQVGSTKMPSLWTLG